MRRIDAIHHAREKSVCFSGYFRWKWARIIGNGQINLSSYNDHANPAKSIAFVVYFLILHPLLVSSKRTRQRERENDLKSKRLESEEPCNLLSAINRWLDSFPLLLLLPQRNIPFRFIFYIKNLHKKIRTLSTLEKWEKEGRKKKERERKEESYKLNFINVH